MELQCATMISSKLNGKYRKRLPKKHSESEVNESYLKT